MGGFAWVTLATNDSYSLGALVLAHSLKQAGTAHQLAVLVTPGVTNAMREKLATVFNIIQEVNVLDSRDEANLKLLKRPELGITFTKLHCWRLTQFDKCVFLDADTLVLQNCDELFERDELSAAPDVGWPDCFNSGVFVYRPSTDTYDSLIQLALEKGSFDGGDQGLLNLYFSDWAHKDISKHLPFIYNMCSTACYSYLPAFRQFGANAKIVHFIGASKPWLQYFNTETRKVQPSGDSSHLQEVLQRWWDIFCSLIHPHLSPAMAGLAGAFAQLTLGVPRTTQQDALENLLRKQAWEVGNIDYLGRDSFDNIWSKITETLSAGLPSETTLEIAPVQSQPTASPQEVAKSVENSVILQSVGTTKSEPIQVQPSAVETLVAPSESATQPSADTSKTEPVEVDDHSPVETSVPPSQSAAITTKSEPVEAQSPPLQSSGAPLQKKEALLASDTLKSLPVEAQSAPVDTSVTKEPKVATDLTKSQPLEIQSTQTSGSLPAATLQTELVKSSPASPVAAKSAVDESKLKGAPRGAQPVDVAKSSPVQSVESPIPTELVASVEPPKTLKQSPAATPQAETTPSKYAPVVQPTESPKTAPSPPKPISQSSTAPVASSQPSKDSPKTKITEATPPATPSSPQLEKTKQALAAEASISETPPPTEGSSVPTPPPRKTDKPKKTVTKPKK